jgi:hypothetical protein
MSRGAPSQGGVPVIGGRLNFEAATTTLTMTRRCLSETSVGDRYLNSQIIILPKESRLPAYTLTHLDDGGNFSPPPVAVETSTAAPQRIVITRKQLDTSQLHS